MSENYKIYKIQKGDNLTKIAKMFDTTVDELVKLNNIENPNLIYADADLKVPKNEEELAAEATSKAAADAEKIKAAKEKAAQVAAAKKAEEEAKAAEEAGTLKGKIKNIFSKDK